MYINMQFLTQMPCYILVYMHNMTFLRYDYKNQLKKIIYVLYHIAAHTFLTYSISF